MIHVSRQFEWDMGHRVTNHESKCRNPHGHRYRLIVEVGGELIDTNGASDQGMVVDFGSLKNTVVTHIIDSLDHSFVYWEQDAIMIDFAKKNKDLKLHKMSFIPTAENLVMYIAQNIKALLLTEFPALELYSIILYETPNSFATWTNSGA